VKRRKNNLLVGSEQYRQRSFVRYRFLGKPREPRIFFSDDYYRPDAIDSDVYVFWTTARHYQIIVRTHLIELSHHGELSPKIIFNKRRYTMKTLNMHGSFYDREDEPTRITTKLLLGIVGIWFVAAFVGGMVGLFYQPNEPPLYVGLFLLVPILGFTLAYRTSSRVQQAVDAVPLRLITIAHILRFVGLGFVIGAIRNVLPAQFGYPAGWGDATAAALCLPLAWAARLAAVFPANAHALHCVKYLRADRCTAVKGLYFFPRGF
jgi:hypothetical protein